MIKLKLLFKLPATGASVTVVKGPDSLTVEAELIHEIISLRESGRFFDMERAFNEMTKGRLHVELIET